MTRDQVTRWSAIEHQSKLRYGQQIAEDCLVGLIDGRTIDEWGHPIDPAYEIDRGKAWQEHNAVAARYAMQELFTLIASNAAPAHVPHYEARIESHYELQGEAA